MNQWYDSAHHRVRVSRVGLLGGGYHELKRPHRLSHVTDSRRTLHMERYGDRFGLLIFDECHHLPSPTYLHAAECSIAPYRLGLTATLERTDRRESLLGDCVGAVVYARSNPRTSAGGAPRGSTTFAR